MALLELLAQIDLSKISIAVPVLVLLWHVVPYLADPHCIRSNGITGAFWARFTDGWLGWVAAHGHRSEVVHEQHKRLGTFVRLAPNHVSIADPDALPLVYGHGTGTLKSDFYDAFVSIRRGLFNTRSRTEHARKRKIVSHIFAQKSVLAFEPHVRKHVGELLGQWDRLCAGGVKGKSGDDGQGGWFGRDGRVWFDCLPWYNYLAFDIIGDLAFGSPFGMINAAKDGAPVAKDQKAAIVGCGSEGSDNIAAHTPCDVVSIPAVKILNDRGDYSASMGVLPPWWRPLAARYIPWFARGRAAVKNLAGLAVAAVAKRFAQPTERTDLLSKLQDGKDDEGNPMGVEELTAEAQTQLIAGSDTTSNSSCAITYYLALHPSAQSKLQKELDDALGSPSDSTADTDANEPDPVASFEQVKRLTYFEAVINEALRLHSTSAIGLPRLVPPGGLTVLGKTFPEGTVLSVPSYTIHRDRAAWGEDADVFRPERWLDGSCDPQAMQKAFNPFSYGPRACVGRNLALMELLIIIATIFRRYDFVLEEPDKPFATREGFLRKPLQCRVGMKRRSS